MKKLFVLGIVLIMSLGFFGCSSSNDGGGGEDDPRIEISAYESEFSPGTGRITIKLYNAKYDSTKISDDYETDFKVFVNGIELDSTKYDDFDFSAGGSGPDYSFYEIEYHTINSTIIADTKYTIRIVYTADSTRNILILDRNEQPTGDILGSFDKTLPITATSR